MGFHPGNLRDHGLFVSPGACSCWSAMASRRLPAGTVPYPVGVRARVVLAEDNALLRHGLVRLIEAAPDSPEYNSALPGVVMDKRGPPIKATPRRCAMSQSWITGLMLPWPMPPG